MEKNVSRTVLIMIGVSDALLVAFTAFLFYSNSQLKDEASRLRAEKIGILEEHGECLKYKENSLKKELIEKYMESMISLRNKVENGYVPGKDDIGSFLDRSSYIMDNLEIYEPSKEKISQYLLFISSMKKILEPFTGPAPEVNSDGQRKN
ncbi:MAG TPA: hypothetical protein P5044_06675 [bacterium]|nr:hypothetical protein [bacterium]